MSKTIILKGSNHNFVKTNLVTERDRQGAFDTMRCGNCGLEGKRRSLDRLDVDGRASDRVLENCPKAVKPQTEIPKKVRIKNFGGYSSNFTNITEGSIHNVVEPTGEHKIKFPNSRESVWIMGVREPARLLPGEFEIVE